MENERHERYGQAQDNAWKYAKAAEVGSNWDAQMAIMWANVAQALRKDRA